MRGRIAFAAVVALALSAATAPAQAQDRYASPAGTGSACTAAEPCDILTAVNSAMDGDLVHVAGGVYPQLDTNVNIPPGVTVVGEGGERPKISFGSSGTFTASIEAAVSGLDLRRDSGFAVLFGVGPTGTASRMRVESTGSALAVVLHGLLRDSLVDATGTAPAAVQVGGDSGRLHNVTARAAGANAAAVMVYSDSASFPLPCTAGVATLRNVIVRAQHDLWANGVPDCPATFDVGHSNYRPGSVLISGGGEVIDSGGNQTAVEPLLGPDGLHQLAGSPTIDAGLAAPQNGPFDFDGEPRLLGNAPDIGADEFPPPALAAPDTTAPVGSALRLTPRRFRPARRPPRAGASASRRRRGAFPRTSRVRYRLSEDATVRFTVRRRVRGVRRGKRCLIGKAARRKTGKRCRKLVVVGVSFSKQGRQGANAFRFAGYVKHRGRRVPERRMRALSPGAYRLVGEPTDAQGNRGREFGAPFAIARR